MAPTQSPSNTRFSRGLAPRFILLTAILGSEALLASYYLDSATLARKHGILTDLLHDWGAWTLRIGIGFAALFTTFAWLKHKPALIALSGRGGSSSVSLGLFAAHGTVAAIFAALSAVLYGAGGVAIPSDLIVAVWAVCAVAVVASAALALISWPIWSELLRTTGNLWLYAAGAAIAACVLGLYSRALWAPTTRLTFQLVRMLLQPLFHDLIIQPGIMRLGTHRFTAIVTPECSGLEGAGLLLVFGVLWLLLFREESRFPQSFVLLPAAVVVLFLLNAVRIAVLILIGHAGARDVAMRGFHSQAGWIAFNGVAFAFSAAARRLSWFSKHRPEPRAAEIATYNPATAYLVPFLAILAARMISRAISGKFEWFYPLGFFAAAGAIWALRRRYADLSWKVGWLAPGVGFLVFVFWVLLDRITSAASDAGMPDALAGAPAALRDSWIALRVLSAVVTVPLAEELAFRGFLLRRLIGADFDAVSFRTFTWLSLLASSLAFGAMHGDRWLAGTAAGALYAATTIRTGRLSEAIVAHATTNALLAAYVLGLQKWQFW